MRNKLIVSGLFVILVFVAGCVWRAAQVIDFHDDGDAFEPQIAMDPNGNAIAVWYQDDGVEYSIWANRYDVATGSWGKAVLLELNSGSAVEAQIAVDRGGNGIAVWSQWDGARNNIWANRYEAATDSWGKAQLIEKSAADAGAPRIAIDPDAHEGNAIVVWQEHDGTRHNIWANRYNAAIASWDKAQVIEKNSEEAGGPQIAMDHDGSAIAVWFQKGAWANRYDAAADSWGNAKLISNNIGCALYPQIAMDPGGNAIAVWRQNDGRRENVWASRYSVVTGWGKAGLIETNDTGNVANPQVAMDHGGNAIAVWAQHDGTMNNIWANRYAESAGSWGKAELIELNNSGEGVVPQIAMDPYGNAIAIWMQHDGTRYDIWVNNYFSEAGAWHKPERIEFETGEAWEPQIAMDHFSSHGRATAVWRQSEGFMEDIRANRFE